MKKSNIWICTCVHLLLYITVAAYSSEIGNPITDDIKKISLVRQNIPKDYKIAVRYIPKEVSGMCWIKLNVFNLEYSLSELGKKFGNISSNKDNISTFIQILHELRYHIGNNLEDLMLEFECHYMEEKWQTAKYFDFVEDFFNTANVSRDGEDCEPPPCLTKPTVSTTAIASTVSAAHRVNGNQERSLHEQDKAALLSKVVESSLLSLLVIPFIAMVFLLVWKVKSRRNIPPSEMSPEEGPALFSGEEANLPPLDVEISEKNRLNMIRAV